MQVGVDYSEVPGVSPSVTLALVNGFILNTAQFLNKFAETCDSKLRSVSHQIKRIEITLNLLEAKLNSIEGLTADAPGPAAGDAAAGAAPGGAGIPAAPPPPGSGAPIPPPPLPPGSAKASGAGAPPPPSGDPLAAAAAAAAAMGESQAEASGLLVKQDPRYAPFFKMLQYGVPLAQVQAKMMSQGIDPNILENPNAPSDYKGSTDSGSDAGEADDDWDD